MKPELEIEVLRRSTPAEGLDPDLRLTPPEWRLFTAADGRVSQAEWARRFGWSGEAITLVADKLKAAGLLAIAEYTSSEYHEHFSTVLEAAPAQTSTPGPEPAPRRFTGSLKRRSGTALPARPPIGTADSEPVGTVSPTPDARPTNDANRRDSFHLRPLIDFIVSTAGGGTKGQLAVYRVFCKVPNQLLLKSRITSLNLVGDDFEIQDPDLKARLLESTRAVLGVDYV